VSTAGDGAGVRSEVVTLGCRLNALESEIIQMRADEANLSGAVIFNTCAVTSEAERQARQAIRKLRRERPEAEIIVTGCAAQIAPKTFADMPEVNRVIGNDEKLARASYGIKDRVAVANIMDSRAAPEHTIGGFETRTRAFVQIQQGCDHRCTFCIIPFGRGNSRSLNAQAVLRQAQRLTSAGYREIVLTGVDISSYGADLNEGMTLGTLCRFLLAHTPDLARLRLSSLDPAVIDESLLELIGEDERLMPHLHLSVQAGSDMILKRMKRRHLRADVIALAERLRAARGDLVLGADLITGFPTESDEMFEDSMRIVEEADLTYLHVFPFSARTGTPAARMPQLSGTIRRERAARLRALGDQRRDRYLASLLGAEAEILAEKDGRGYTRHYAPARIDRAVTAGEIVRVRIIGTEGGTLTARLAAQAA
jgi:threonylcarbamoyladenosine tRNA methylthiotransferase MtaB